MGVTAVSEATIDVHGLAETERIGRGLGGALQAGDFVALIGPLGAGKTTLVKGIAAGAGVPDRRQVNSPTFVLVNEYEAPRPGGSLRLYHVDAYRLRGADDLEDLGFDEMCERGAVLLEWADRVADLLPADRLTASIEPTGPEDRRLHLTATGPRSVALLDGLLADR
jgi:tRNA threonylcarbamoyladenosine biosynthesis protein TsaE